MWRAASPSAPDGRTAVSGSSDGNAEALGPRRRTRTAYLHRALSVEREGVAIAPDGRTALSGSGTRSLKLWDLATGKELRTFTGHSGAVT